MRQSRPTEKIAGGVGFISRPERHILSLSGKLLQNGIVDREFIFGIVFARIGIRHQQCDRRAFRGVRKVGKKFASALNDRISFA